MAWLSQRLVRSVLLPSAVSLLGYASPASAQLPVFQATPEPAAIPAVPSAPAEPAPPPPSAVAVPAEPLPVAPALPPGIVAPPSLATSPAPAKADLITDPNARRATEARIAEDAAADEDAATDAEERRQWYGWQTLVVDGTSLAALLVGASLTSQRSRNDGPGDTLVGAGLLGYVLAPGIVHLVHRNPGRGFASVGLRLGMPLAAAFLGASLASGCNTNLCESNGAGIGVLLGMGGAVAIDAALFAYDDAKRSSSRHLDLLPVMSVTPQQAWIGLAGHL
jgi:hypothetical protein